jgi:hypothetical protein
MCALINGFLNKSLIAPEREKFIVELCTVNWSILKLDGVLLERSI